MLNLFLSGVHRHFFELVYERFRGFECFKAPYMRWYKSIIGGVFSCIVFIHEKLVRYRIINYLYMIIVSGKNALHDKK